MKYSLFILMAWIGMPSQTAESLFVCKNAVVNIYSKAPIEDIEATSNKGTSVYNPTTGDLAFSVPVRSLKFDKALMEEHFNENYMESDKFPQALFKGKVLGNVDISHDGNYPVTASGVLDVHGVKQTRAIPGNISIHNGAVTITAEFMVKCADHQITIPTLVFHNIAESIRIKLTASYTLYKK